jgi:aminoglycoside phosphotransferase
VSDETASASPDDRLAEIGERCNLGAPEVIVQGYGGRSRVGVFRRGVVKIYTYKPEVKRPREVSSLRSVADLNIAPKVLVEGDDWIAMSRIPGHPLAEIPDHSRTADMAEQIGRYLRLIHESGHHVAGDFDLNSCRRVLCHGDFSGRNVMADASGTDAAYQVAGVIDFEKSEVACFATDLVRFRLSTIMGFDHGWDQFVIGYTSFGAVDISREHLAYHLRDYIAWAANWAPQLDPPFARIVREAASAMVSSG